LPERSSAADCAFCRIVSGEAESHVVFEDDVSLAFLDNRPLFPGHSLLVPRRHLETIWDLNDDLLAELFVNARMLSAAIRSAMESQGAFVAANNVVSQSVPHFHIHLVPRNRKDGLRGFFWPRSKYSSDAEARAAAQAVRDAVASLT
jgi:histidine triad (HIT) family protein